jgi:hypothetical protein
MKGILRCTDPRIGLFGLLIITLFLVDGCSRGDGDSVDTAEYDYCKVIRKIQVLPPDDGSESWETLSKNTPERIWLINICFPEEDTIRHRPSIDISVEEDYPVIVEFDTIQSFPDARSAKVYAKANRIVDVVF